MCGWERSLHDGVMRTSSLPCRLTYASAFKVDLGDQLELDNDNADGGGVVCGRATRWQGA